ncbi:MAG: rhodanese-like domain-containing protein [Pseudomonadota bacterium]
MARHMISPTNLFSILPRPDAPAILDLRTPEDAVADPTLLPAARRLTLAQIEAGQGGDGPAVVYCQKGGKVSQLGAALLRRRDVPAQALTGGHLAWVAAGLPVRPLDSPRGAIRVVPDDVDWAGLCRLWRLLRLVDPTARVLAVAADQVGAGSAVIGGTTLDEDVPDWPAIPEASPPLEALLRGRLARTGDPVAALDLVDDALAGAAS